MAATKISRNISFELNKTYTFTCEATFGTLSQERVNTLLRDGRKASGFLEIQLLEWFPELKFEDKKGYDYVDANGQQYDAKCFTKGGSNFSPSGMQGKGRKVNMEKLWNHAGKMIYIFTDIVEFPIVNVRFVKGSDLTQYKNGKINFKDRNVFFG